MPRKKVISADDLLARATSPKGIVSIEDSPLRYCVGCGSRIYPAWNYCGYCGTKITQPGEPK